MPKEKHTIVQYEKLGFDTYIRNIEPCKHWDVDMEEIEVVKGPQLSVCVDPDPITRLVSGQLAINCSSTYVPMVHLLPYNIQN